MTRVAKNTISYCKMDREPDTMSPKEMIEMSDLLIMSGLYGRAIELIESAQNAMDSLCENKNAPSDRDVQLATAVMGS